MAKKSKTGSAEDLELNLTPMIDVVFNLIVFFMIVIDLTQQDLEELKLPWSVAAVEDKDDEEEYRVVINVAKKYPDEWPQNREVSIVVKREELDYEALKRLLVKRAELKRDSDHPANPSEIYVLIRADKDIRWREIQWVMQAAADPAARIYKIQFATAKPANEG